MTDIVIYARYSSDKQTEQSIDGQLRVCNDYAKAHDYNVINHYIDRAMTGRNDNRPAFLEMIEDAKKNQFKYILVYKLDRFSRNKYDSVVYKHKLGQYGVKVISATESISDSPEGTLMEGILEMFAEMFSKDLSQKVKRGIKESVLKGNYIGGTQILGYDVIDKKLVINPKEAEAVKYIFNEYANGKPKTQIVDEVNKLGYRTKKNQKLTPNSIQRLLKNKRYLGMFETDYVKNNNFCEPIIDINTFNKVQNRLIENKHHATKSKAKEEYILSGKLYCGHCKTEMIGISGTSKTKQIHRYYVCKNRRNKNNCSKSNENKETLESAVINSLKKILNNDKLDKIAEKIYTHLKSTSENKRIQFYKTELTKIENQLDNIATNVINTTNNDILTRLNAQANDLSEQKDAIKSELNKLTLLTKACNSKEIILNYLQTYIENPNIDDKALIDTFVDKIYVYDDYLDIYINTTENDPDEGKKRFDYKIQASTTKRSTRKGVFLCHKTKSVILIKTTILNGKQKT